MFVTAFDRYAIRAFEVDALDDLLKQDAVVRIRSSTSAASLTPAYLVAGLMRPR